MDISVIDGQTQRDRATTHVHRQLAESYDKLVMETGRMSAFMLIAFDDEGNATSVVHLGEMFPVPPVMLPEIVKQLMTVEVYSR